MNQSIQQKLCELVATYGNSLGNEPQRCQSLLANSYNQNPGEIFVLVSAIKEQIVANLLVARNNVPREILLQQLSNRLQHNLFLVEKAARWSVESWAIALGLIKHGEWQPPSNVSSKLPKIENLPQQKLCQIIKSEPSLINNPQKCEALLRDYCNQYSGEISALVNALREGIVADLLTSPSSTPQLAQRLQNNLYLAPEAAQWAVNSWKLAIQQLANPMKSNLSSTQPPSLPSQPSVATSIKTKTNNRKHWLWTSLGTAGVVASIAAGCWIFLKPGLGEENPIFGGDNVLNVGVVTTKYNSEDKYYLLVDYLKSELGEQFNQEVVVEIETVDFSQPESLKQARTKIQAKDEWDLAFTTAPLLSVSAIDNEYALAARMFPKAKQYESALFVKADSEIKSIADLNQNTIVALGEFNNISGFYMPVYDLYTKIIRVDVNNPGTEAIMNKVASGQADAGAGAYQIVSKNPNFRVIHRSRPLPLAGVFISPALTEKEQNLVKEALLNAPDELQEQAQYTEDSASNTVKNLNIFVGIVKRVDKVMGCVNWKSKNPVELFCPDQNKEIIGTVKSYTIQTADTINITLQGNDNNVYRVVLPQKFLEQLNLPILPDWHGQTIQILNLNAVHERGALTLSITEPGQIKMLQN